MLVTVAMVGVPKFVVDVMLVLSVSVMVVSVVVPILWVET